MHVLLVNLESSAPPLLGGVLSRPDCKVTQVGSIEAAHDANLLGDVDAVLVWPGSASAESPADTGMTHLMDALEARCVGTMLLDPHQAPPISKSRPLVTSVSSQVSPEELWGRLATMSNYSGVLRRMERELNNMQQLGKKLNQHFAKLDHEMHLASRLQRDFLPDKLPEVPPVMFSVLFRPAQWVSGDTYDVFRVDEDHVGFYVVDAVGHGVAAGLLTMFVKKALPTKLVELDSYTLLKPSESLRALNQALCEQELPGNQFVTACYCLLNTKTLELQIARGGHPYPLHVTTDGKLTPLKVEGGLMGLLPDEEYPLKSTQLHPGEKVLLFSDGLELAFAEEPGQEVEAYRYEEEFASLATLSADDLVLEFARRLDQEEGSLNPRDDVTMVAMEVRRD